MKITEIILSVLILIGLTLSLLNIPGGATLLGISLLILVGIYSFFGFALFKVPRGKNIFKKASYDGVSSGRMTGSILFGINLVFLACAPIFKIQMWPGYTIFFLVSFVGIITTLIVGSIRYGKNKHPFYKGVFTRIAIWGGFALIVYTIPRIKFIELQFVDYPDYIEACKAADENPTDENYFKREVELWKTAYPPGEYPARLDSMTYEEGFYPY